MLSSSVLTSWTVDSVASSDWSKNTDSGSRPKQTRGPQVCHSWSRRLSARITLKSQDSVQQDKLSAHRPRNSIGIRAIELYWFAVEEKSSPDHTYGKDGEFACFIEREPRFPAVFDEVSSQCRSTLKNAEPLDRGPGEYESTSGISMCHPLPSRHPLGISVRRILRRFVLDEFYRDSMASHLENGSDQRECREDRAPYGQLTRWESLKR